MNLSKESKGLKKIVLGLGWQGLRGRSLDLDSYVAFQDENGKNLKFIYFGKKKWDGVKHHGDDLVGGGSANSINEKITITLDELKGKVHRIIAGLFIYSGASNLSKVDHAFISLSNQNNQELVRFNIKEDFGKSKSLTVGEFRKTDNEWRFKATGVGSSDGFRAIQRKFKSNSNNYESPRRRGFLGVIGSVIGSAIDEILD